MEGKNSPNPRRQDSLLAGPSLFLLGFVCWIVDNIHFVNDF